MDLEKMNKPVEKKKIRDEMNEITDDLKSGFKFIFHSKRLRTLLIMLGTLWGIIDVYGTYQDTLLKELQVPSYYMGFIFAGFQMLVRNIFYKSK